MGEIRSGAKADDKVNEISLRPAEPIKLSAPPSANHTKAGATSLPRPLCWLRKDQASSGS